MDVKVADEPLFSFTLLKLPLTMNHRRRGHSCVVFSQGRDVPFSRKNILVIGGETRMNDNENTQSYEYVLNNIELFNFDSEKSCKVETTIRISFHCSVLVGHRLFLFGGFNGSKSKRQIYTLDLKTKEIYLVNKFKRAMDSFSANLCNNKKEIIVFGGWNGKNTRYNDVLKYDVDKNEIEEVVPVNEILPSSRCGHSSVVYREELIVFGGNDGRKRLSDCYKFIIKLRIWKKVKFFGVKPSPRSGHSVCVFKRHFMLLVGGFTGKRKLVCNDSVYILNLTNFVWQRVELDFPFLMNASLNSIFEGNFLCMGGLDCENMEYKNDCFLLSMYSRKEDYLRKKIRNNKYFVDVCFTTMK